MHRQRVRGFTLIELMVTLVVLIVLLLIAVPSFMSFQQRSALRGGAEEVLSLWNQARFEAAKRNSKVKFGVLQDGANFCIGVATTADAADEDPCDCMDADACDVGRFPANQSEWRGVTLTGAPTLGDDSGVVVIDPKFTSLTEFDDAGSLSLSDPAGGNSYQLNVHIDRMGRGYLCESSSAVDDMSDYTNRTCDP